MAANDVLELMLPMKGPLLFGGFGHNVAGLCGQAGAFELNGRVLDAKLLCGNVADGFEQALALVHVHVGDAGVETKRIVTAAEGPEVDVVNFLHAFDSENRTRDFFDLQLMGTAFQEKVRRFAQDADAGPEDESTDAQAKKRIDPGCAGFSNYDCTDNDSHVGKSIAEIVNQDATKIEVASTADERQGDAAIDGQRGDRGPDHPFFDHFDGRAEALHSFIAQPERKQHEDESIGEGG